ncbi:MAG: LPS export ABC transporter periplasmic protein LptC [Sphingobacteriales bacterium]|nr:LPS export ABC transporter periplasmic protein LptC [Sphingobacteriales bacterium]
MKQLVLFFVFCFFIGYLQAQQPGAPTHPFPQDTVKRVDIIHSDKLDYLYVDSLHEYQQLIGHVKLRQGNTLFYADSVALNQRTNIAEAFGNIHINDADSVHTYAQYLKYFGDTKLAQLRKKVKLSDGKGVLTTDSLDYDVGAHIGSFKKGGKVVNGKTTLTSEEGFYYADTREVYFKKKVNLVDPEYRLATDTLLYNTDSQVATFLAPTTIDDGTTRIYTSDGYYNLKTGQGNFGKRSIIQDSTQTIVGDVLAFEKKTGQFEGKGNVVYKDSSQGVVVISNHLYGNRDKKSVLATEKPVMILKQEADSIYVAADTLFSGLMRDLDSLQKIYGHQKDSIILPDSLMAKKDSLPANPVITSKNNIPKQIPVSINEIKEQPAKEYINDKEITNTEIALSKKDSIDPIGRKDSIAIKKLNNFAKARQDSIKARTDTLRFFTGFHHVRIFSDSMQAVADSMYFSSVDSVFRLYQSPVVWSKENQITGDTMYLFTKKRKPDHLQVFEKGLAINHIEKENYNQLKGRTINGFFRNGNIENIRAKGNSESIYYAQDEDSSYIGVNRTTADMIDMYFANKELKKVVFRNDVKGKTVPIREADNSFTKLPEFKWWDKRRPKTKYELFQ